MDIAGYRRQIFCSFFRSRENPEAITCWYLPY